MVILNAAVVHSADHTTLHTMMNERPVPFVLRVLPPRSADATLPISGRTKAIVTQIKQAFEELPDEKKRIATEECIGAGIQY